MENEKKENIHTHIIMAFSASLGSRKEKKGN